MRLTILFFILIHTFYSIKVFAIVTATVDRKTINEGQNIRLNINSDDANGDTPNIKKLNRNFSIIGSSKVNRPYIKNGQRKQQSLWFYILRPKRSGNLVIPALSINNESTKPIKLKVIARKVKKAPIKPKEKDENIYRNIIVKGTIDKTKVFPNEMLTYTLTINYPANGQIKDDTININSPFVADAVIIPIEDSKYSESLLRGKQRRIRTQTYAIFSKNIALYQIEPASIRLNHTANRQQPSLKANQLHYEVIPSANQNSLGYWLPTEELRVNEEWTTIKDLHVGSKVKRVIEIKATGLNAEILPLISSLNHEAMDLKLENIEVNNTIENGKLVAIRRETVSILFKKEGTVSIEPIDIHWWNIKANQARITTISPKAFHIQNTPLKPISSSKESTSTLTQKTELVAPLNQKVTNSNNTDTLKDIKSLARDTRDTQASSQAIKSSFDWSTLILSALLVITSIGWLISIKRKRR